MKNVFEIADWFLNKDSMTPKKLQKLCYYAQAWFVTLYNDGELFPEEIEAWVHGPVIPKLYGEYKNYAWSPIPKKDDLNVDLTDNEQHLLDSIWETYGSWTGDELEQLTHSEEPWIEARHGLEAWEPGFRIISLEKMKEFYGKKFEEAQGE